MSCTAREHHDEDDEMWLTNPYEAEHLMRSRTFQPRDHVPVVPGRRSFVTRLRVAWGALETARVAWESRPENRPAIR